MAKHILDFINLKNFNTKLVINPDCFKQVNSATYKDYRTSYVDFQMLDGRVYNVVGWSPNVLPEQVRLKINRDTIIQYYPDQFSLFSFDVRLVTVRRTTIDYYFYYDEQTNETGQFLSQNNEYSIDGSNLDFYSLLSSDKSISDGFNKVGVYTNFDYNYQNLPAEYKNKIINIQWKLRIKSKKHPTVILVNNNGVQGQSGSILYGDKDFNFSNDIIEMDKNGTIQNFLRKVYPYLFIQYN